MKFYRLVGVVFCFQVVRYASAAESTQSKNQNSKYPIEYPDIIIEKILHHLGTNRKYLVDLTQINSTLGYSQHSVQVAASILKDQHVYSAPEKVLALRSKVDTAFDIINQNINSIESSLNPGVCIGDFGVLNVQNALQNFIDLCASLNFGGGVISSTDAKIFSSGTIDSSAYCLSSAIETFVTSVSSVEKELTTNKIAEKSLIGIAQAIVESVFSIIDNVLRGLKEMKGHEQVFDNQHVSHLLSAIGKLVRQRPQLANFADEASPLFMVVANNTKTSMENLPFIMDANMAILVKYILTPQEGLPTFNSTLGPIKSMQLQLRELSYLVHSIRSANLNANSIDLSSQNLVATFTYLTDSVSAVPTELIYIREFHELIEPNFQANLLIIISNIRALNDEITIIVQRRLIDLICFSTSMDKTNLKKISLELQSSVEAIILTYEKLVRSAIEAVRNHMYSVYAISELYEVPDYDDEARTLFRDTIQLIGELDRILSNKLSSNLSTNENAFTVCAKGFEEVAHSSIELRTFLNKSIKQIERYLL